MRAFRRLSSLALVAFILSSCDAVSPSEPLTLTPLMTSSPLGLSGVGSRGSIVITNAQAFADFWAEANRRLTPVPPLPEVDFSKEIVVGFAMGQQPTSGYDVRVHDPQRSRGVVTLKVEETLPGPDCPLLQVITAPIDLARLTRTGDEIRFENETVVRGCGG